MPRRSAQPRGVEAVDRLGGLGQREAELLVRVARSRPRAWVSVWTSGTTRSSTGCGPSPASSLEAVELVEVVDRAPRAGCSTAARSSASDFALPCTTIRSASKPAPQREVQLARRGDVDAQPLLGEDPQHRGAGEGLGGEQHARPAAVVGAHRAHELARPRAQVVLGHDVGGRAELARELEDVAAADREPALVHGRGLGVDGQRRGGHDARRLCAMRPPLPRPSSARSTGWPTRCGCPRAIRGPAW